MARSDLDRAALARIGDDPAIREQMRRFAEEILDDAQGNLVHNGNVDTGALYRCGFVDEDTQTGTLRIGFGDDDSGVDYAKYVEAGTGPHVIRAKPGHTLSWGGDHFATEVHHPGTKPTHFLTEAALKQRRPR